MNNKIISFLLAVLILPGVFVSYGFTISSVTVLDANEQTVKSYFSGTDITSALSRALDFASKNASRRNHLTIKLSKGTYNVKKTLHLSSFTEIDLNGARIKNANSKRGNIFKSPEDREYPEYSSLTECVIKNGILDGNYNQNKSCILRLCHCENVTVENVRFLNNYYSHHCELAASRNVVFKNCTFSGQISDLKVSSSEAIQIDILDKVHFYGFTSYDNTMNQNISVENCIFKNVYRGVGTHNYFRDMYQTNITISGCTFENITDCAISAVNFKNVSFKNNIFLNCKYSSFYCDNGK